jgi:hypothetical protein
MTSIEVPDWVVDAGDAAIDTFAEQNTMSMFVSRDDYHKAMLRSIITAALGAWVVQVGYQETITVQDDGVFADIEQKLWHWIPGKPIPESTADTFREPIYTLTQVKP